MKINLDCIRDILIYIEEHLTVPLHDNLTAIECNSLDVLNLSKDLPNYKRDDIWYSVKMLTECNYIDTRGISTQTYFSMMYIDSMTYAGHKFLESIRPQSVWDKTKSIISKVGSHTLEFIEDTAQKIAIEYAKSLINSAPINTPSNTK